MPTTSSKTTRKVPAAKVTQPRPREPKATRLTASAAQAEAAPDQFTLYFTWRDHLFTVDTKTVRFGAAAFSIRKVGNENIGLYERVQAMADALSAAIGEEQLNIAFNLDRNLFDDSTVMTSFWEAFTQAVHGASTGESSAS